MTAGQRRALGVPEQDREWVSSLTGARYRWRDGQWEFHRANGPDKWHFITRLTVYTYAGEYFLEAPPL